MTNRREHFYVTAILGKIAELLRAQQKFGLRASAAIFVLCPMQAWAQNLVENLSFELSTSDSESTGWKLNGNDGTAYFDGQTDSGGRAARSGEWSVDFAAVNSTSARAGSLSHAIATTAMTTYVVSFY